MNCSHLPLIFLLSLAPCAIFANSLCDQCDSTESSKDALDEVAILQLIHSAEKSDIAINGSKEFVEPMPPATTQDGGMSTLQLAHGAEKSAIVMNGSQELWKPMPQATTQNGGESILTYTWIVGVVIGIAVLLLGSLASMFLFDTHTQSKIPATKHRLMLQILSVVELTVWKSDFSGLIPCSYDLSLAMGYGPTTSGFFMSTWNLFLIPGLLTAKWSQGIFEYSSLRRFAIAGLVLLSIIQLGLGLFFFQKKDDMLGYSNSSQHQHDEFTLWVLLCARAASGFTSGAVMQLVSVAAVKASPKTQVQTLSILLTAGRNAGLVVGPALFSLVNIFALSPGEVISPFGKVALPMFVLSLVWSVLALCFSFTLPFDKRLETPQAAAGNVQEQHEEVDLPLDDRKLAINISQAFTVLRCFTCESIEMSTTLLLEIQYQWKPDIIGLSLGVVALISVCATLTSAGLLRGRIMKESSVLYYSSILGVVGVLLLYNIDLGIGATQLIFANSLVYGGAYISSGIMEGLANVVAIEDTIYSVSNINWIKIVASGVARSFASPFARWMVKNAGRNAYATFQVVVQVVFDIAQHKIGHLCDQMSHRGKDSTRTKTQGQ